MAPDIRIGSGHHGTLDPSPGQDMMPQLLVLIAAGVAVQDDGRLRVLDQ